ncbi:DUF7146 domain-containing protein [Shimia sp.]|uniref:DUF7146 domain-containing protein n=1 Tax=Shimia sp. TaxID=1954381 RepID=UPI003B8DBADC
MLAVPGGLAMSRARDPRIDQAKDMTVQAVVQKLRMPNLVENSGWLSGPCFECGGTDRFNINVDDKGYFCRHQCGVGGSDMISLTQEYLKLSFPDALTALCGDRPSSVDPELQRKRQENQKRLADEAERNKNKYRDDAIKSARRIWRQSEYHPQHPMLLQYFEIRGIARALLPDLPKSLRFHPNLRYAEWIKDRNAWLTLHEGPAMVAAVVAPDGVGRAVHRTWLDLDQPMGKAKIEFEGKVFDAKKVIGSKKGGAVPLSFADGAKTLVMAEGIETTMTAMIARPFPDAVFWAGVDLGNMSGKMQRGKGLKYAGLPKLDDAEAFVPPEWVSRLVFVQDGDSDPRMTRAKCLSGLRRAQAKRPGIETLLVHPGGDFDLNDILTRQPEQLAAD